MSMSFMGWEIQNVFVFRIINGHINESLLYYRSRTTTYLEFEGIQYLYPTD